MDKVVVSFVGGVLIVAFVFFAAANVLLFSQAPSNTGNTVLQPQPQNPLPSGNAQIINLSAVGSSYLPSVITVNANQLVRLVGDIQNLPGCSRAFVIPKLGVRKVFREGDNILEFTPSQKGSFAFSCSMGMYRGTLNVV